MEIIRTQSEKIITLTRDNVEELHSVLSNNLSLLEQIDPVEPPGIKSENLLESAVQRQLTGSENWYKYDNCFSNCATLLFGVIKGHAFHNGNKRTALLCMIKHLYLNGYVLKPDLKHDEIYSLLLSISDNDLLNYMNRNIVYKKWLRNKGLQKSSKLSVDDQISFIEYWIRINTVSKNVQIKSNVRISKLKSILEKKGISLEQSGSRIKVFIEAKSTILGVTTGTKRKNEKEYSLGNSLSEIGHQTLKYLRRDFNLTPNDGVDNIIFYDDEYFLDSEITKYKKLIYRLSKV